MSTIKRGGGVLVLANTETKMCLHLCQEREILGNEYLSNAETPLCEHHNQNILVSTKSGTPSGTYASTTTKGVVIY